MEYRIDAPLIVEPNYLAELILAWYRGRLARHVTTATAFQPYNSQAPRQSTSQRFGSSTTGATSKQPGSGSQTPAERASASLAQRSFPQEPFNVFPISTQPAIAQTGTDFAIGPNVRLHKMSSLGNFTVDYFFWQKSQVLVLERHSGRHHWLKLKAGWDNPHVANPKPVNLGRFNPNAPMQIPVSQMTDTEKLAEAARRAIPKIIERGTDAAQEQIESLTDPETIATMLAIIGISTLFPLVGVGFAIAGAYYLGKDAVKVLENLIDFVKNALRAKTDPDLEKASDNLVEVVVVGGVVVWELLSKKRGKGRKLVKKQPNADTKSLPPAKTPDVEPTKPPKKKPAEPEKKPEPEASEPKKKKPLRDQYLGDTPGKKSRTGREVIERMRNEKPPRIREKNGVTQFQSRKDGEWYDLEQADMAHYPKDAVEYWNTEGKYHGAKSEEVREWMLNSDNYELEYRSHNRSDGAKLNKRYEPPVTNQ